MIICEEVHDEIVHTESDCPLCAALKEVESTNEELKEKEAEVQDLEKQVSDFEDEAEKREREEGEKT